MNTDVGFFGKRVKLISRTSRRWFVALMYSGFAFWILGFPFGNRLIQLISLVAFMVALLIFASVSGTGYEGGDEREEHRRDHVFYVAYRELRWVVLLAFFFSALHGQSPITILMSPSLQAILERVSNAVFFALITLYGTLPQAVLLWTEPDIEESV